MSFSLDFAGILWHKKREQFDFTVLLISFWLFTLSLREVKMNSSFRI